MREINDVKPRSICCVGRTSVVKQAGVGHDAAVADERQFDSAFLALRRVGKSAVAAVIASLLGLPPRAVSQLTKQFLVRAGLVCKDDQGRRQ